MTKFENKSFSVGIGGEAYRKGWDAIDWNDKGNKKEAAPTPAPVEAKPAKKKKTPKKKTPKK